MSAAAVSSPSPVATPDHEVAMKIVMRNVYWSAGVGLIAIPAVDIIGVTAIQLKMLKELADHYDIHFSKDWGKHAIASLTAGLGHRKLAMGFLGSAIKAIPGLGHTFGVLGISILAGGLTYAVGRIFIQHFESRGTLLNFNPAELREQFRQEFERGVEVVKQSQQED